MHTVLVIGGYGFFGARISSELAKIPSVHLLIGGRNGEMARALARTLGVAEEQAIIIDSMSSRLRELLEELRVGTVIHTAGPFQGQDYGVARAAIGAGCHYIDLADGREFVRGISALDLAAKARGVTVVSGASSLPALSGAVVDHYLAEFERLESIRIGISSGAKVPGLATVRGVFGYAGKAVRTLEDGKWVTLYGWRQLERHRFPAPLGARWMAACDVPDLDLLPDRHTTVKTVSFRAGFASASGQLVLWALAGLVEAGLLASVAPLASALNRIGRWMEPLMSERGGMFVELAGCGRAGRAHRVTWNIIADHNHGPFIPCGASIALARRLAEGAPLPAGAMPCVGLITLADYLAALRGLDLKEVVE
jgi:saccharopine dehydrogenase-like NADP-dependent oxidoreductase